MIKEIFVHVWCAFTIAGTAQVVHAQSSSQPISQAAQSASSADLRKTSQEQPPVVVEIKSVPARTPEERAEQAEDRRDKAHTDSSIVVLTAVIAAFTVVLAIATCFLWKSTSDLAREARDSAERQQRAYVNIFKVYAVWEDTTDRDLLVRPISIFIDTRNCGQTPARNVTSWANSTSASTAPVAFPKPHSESLRSVAVCAPGQSYHFEIARTVVIGEESEIARWTVGREALFVWGEVKYTDAFDKERVTRFRYEMPKEGVGNTGGKFKSCGAGNHIT